MMKKNIYLIFFIILFFVGFKSVEARQVCTYDYGTGIGENSSVILVLEDDSEEITAYVTTGGIFSSSFNYVVTSEMLGDYSVEQFKESCPTSVQINDVGWITSINDPLQGGYSADLSDIPFVDVNNYFGFTKTGSLLYNSSKLSSSCSTTEIPVLGLLNIGYKILRIAAPIAIVLFATIDLAKAVAASDESAIKKAQSHCIKRVAAGVIVFLVFVIFELFVNMIPGDWARCMNSILK